MREIGYPAFWLAIRKNFNKQLINFDLRCPMNQVYDLKNTKVQPKTTSLPISEFYIKKDPPEKRKVAKKVEELIEKYSMDLYKYNINYEDELKDEYLLLRSDFENLIEDIRSLTLSLKYSYIFSWLINRAFKITPGIKSNLNIMNSLIDRNKSLLLKTLYEVNQEAFLSCFTEGNEHCKK